MSAESRPNENIKVGKTGLSKSHGASMDRLVHNANKVNPKSERRFDEKEPDENPKFEIIRQPWYWFLGSVASLRKGGRIPSELVDGFSGIRRANISVQSLSLIFGKSFS
ncbi:MAG: hypothetical protein WA705_27170 [Candidatus Ozemobacteraceae bacterium]